MGIEGDKGGCIDMGYMRVENLRYVKLRDTMQDFM